MAYTEEEIENVVLLFQRYMQEDGRCFYCGVKTRRKRGKPPGTRNKQYVFSPPRDQRTADHVIPKCEGGYLTVICCYGCNRAKEAMSLEEFRALRYSDKEIEFYFETELRQRNLI